MDPLLNLDNYIHRRFFGTDISSKEELFESKFFTDISKKNKKQIDQFLKPEIEGTQGICPRCKSENTFLIEKQTRSGDEGKTFSIVCGNCNLSTLAK